MSTSHPAIPRAMPLPWFKQLWPWLLLLGPLTSIVAGSYLAWLAYSAQDAMVVDDYYKEGKAINQDLRRDKAAASLKLSALMEYDAAKGQIKGKLNGPGSVKSGMLSVKLIHPTQPSKDLVLNAQLDASGNFKLALPMLDRAVWQVMLEDQAHQWRLNGNWSWPQQTRTELNPI
ncbi:MAG: FixH family protein [Pseudomonadota bacterium]